MKKLTPNKRKKLILDTAGDLAVDFVAYDRKEDEDLGIGQIEDAVEKGEVTVDEIVARFRERLCVELGLAKEGK